MEAQQKLTRRKKCKWKIAEHIHNWLGLRHRCTPADHIKSHADNKDTASALTAYCAYCTNLGRTQIIWASKNQAGPAKSHLSTAAANRDPDSTVPWGKTPNPAWLPAVCLRYQSFPKQELREEHGTGVLLPVPDPSWLQQKLESIKRIE